ncbi:MAG: 2-C-methyl-D-erythritol 4-phosphate cytidylyltransferase, partial [Magnetovibrio sp.]|nr:2-C-methyl-D-erythritol 4-phosphate cytidylyltransferase [Magnetovibrio sp.]
MGKTVALVVAAGRGRRFGGDLPKQYARLGGQTVLRRTLCALLFDDQVDHVCCVIHPDDEDLYAAATEGLDLLPAVHGGATRQDSVRLGLESLEAFSPQTVLIHDAARPFVSSSVIKGVIKALDTHAGALPALPVADTLKRGVDGCIAGTVSREGLYRAQTPQGFRFADILNAHRSLLGQISPGVRCG